MVPVSKRRAWPLVTAFVFGYVLGKWHMLNADIDEYHALRMDMNEAISDLKEELEKHD